MTMRKLFIVGLLFLSGALCFSQNMGGDDWKNNWLFLGLRLGGSPNFYEPTSADKDAGVDSLDGSFGFNLAAQASVQLVELFAIQMELMYTHDEVSYSESGFKLAFESDSLLIPVLAKLTYRPNNFFIAALGGIYFSVPLGDIKVTESYGGYSASVDLDYKPPMGFMIGINAGMRLGPGVLFADLRYAGDFEETKADTGSVGGSNDMKVYTRGKLPITIGYEIGLISKGGASSGSGRRRR
jgi:hypothetical protein